MVPHLACFVQGRDPEREDVSGAITGYTSSTRYSVRFLFLWLSLLPFALSLPFQEFSRGTWWEDKPQPVPAFAMLFVGFVFLSIEDIAVQIEEPFSILPLVKCHKWLLFEVRRMKSLVSLPDAERRGRGSRRSSE